MKKLILIAAAATMVAVPANAAPNGRNDNRSKIERVHKAPKAQNVRIVQRTVNRNGVQSRNVYRQPVQVRNVYRQPVQVRNVYRQPVQQVRVVTNRGHQWSRGQRFDRRYATNYRVMNDYRAYNLNAPPYGYHYVRSNDDIVLVAIASGLIGAVFASIF